MNLLFVHQTFPGQYKHLVAWAAGRGHRIVFISQPSPKTISGVRRVHYIPQQISVATHPVAREFDHAMRRADDVAAAARELQALGFVPDIIIGHHGWGELLRLPDIWPSVPMIGYLEFFFHTDRGDVGFDPEFPPASDDLLRIRAKNIINYLALDLGKAAQTPTLWQLSTYPEWAQPKINVIREGVDIELCRPASERPSIKIGSFDVRPADKLVTYVARNLEPYRGFHVMMRALPTLLRHRPDVKIIFVGGFDVSYGEAPSRGSWLDFMLDEIGQVDRDRVCFAGPLPYDQYIQVLQRSDAHVYLTYPFVASWSLREALAVGCAIVGSDTAPVAEFIEHGRNGLLTPFLDPRRLAATVLALLDDKPLQRRLSGGARHYAEQCLDVRIYLSECSDLIRRLTGKGL